MRNPNRYIIFFVVAVTLFSPCAFAKKITQNPTTFLNFIVQSDEKYENPELKEKLSKIKEMRKNSGVSVEHEEFKKYDFEDNKRNLSESLIAWLIIVALCMVIMKTICSNFKIPFDYDPNFKNKYISHRKAKNKKYKFQKR